MDCDDELKKWFYEQANLHISSLNIRFHVKGSVILDRGLISSTGRDPTNHIIRRTFKITDDTSTINVTAWNEKTDEIPENIMNKTIRIRNGKINYYNGNRLS
ncbi:unnamed protein product [Adineta ricciae]|uniref:Single-stranded DNA binding protein Ssb-like OB fold domain-containing protein n=1 Tax=Adineta ricciae TaxID=249248 RepID=A0A815TPW0_ADIRI|nr:unnamed protein product [Adineta ricciae]